MPSWEGNNFVFPRVFTCMAWSFQRLSSRETSRIILSFTIATKTTLPSPIYHRGTKQITHDINISFNFIGYGAFCICQFGPAFLCWRFALNSWQHFNGANTKILYHPSSNLMDLHPKFRPLLWSLELIYQDNNGMGGIHRIQLIKCYPQFNVVDYPPWNSQWDPAMTDQQTKKVKAMTK